MRRSNAAISSHPFGEKGPFFTTSSGIARQRGGVAFRDSQIFVVKVIRVSIREISMIHKDEKGVGSLPLKARLLCRQPVLVFQINSGSIILHRGRRVSSLALNEREFTTS